MKRETSPEDEILKAEVGQEKPTGAKPKEKIVSKKAGRRTIIFLFLTTFLLSLFFYARPRVSVWFSQLSFKLKGGQLVRLTNNGATQEVVRDFRRQAENLAGEWAFWTVNLENQAGFGFYQDDAFTVDDLLRLPIVISGYRLIDRGFVNLNEIVELEQADKRLGWGNLKDLPSGEKFELGEVLHLAVSDQDPTAVAMISRRWQEQLEKELSELKLGQWQSGRQSGVEQSLFWLGVFSNQWLKETTSGLLKSSLAKSCGVAGDWSWSENLSLMGCQFDFGPRHRHGVFFVGPKPSQLVIIMSTSASNADFFDQAAFLLERVTE